MIASAVALPAITRILGAGDYGAVTVVATIMVVLAPLFALGIPAAIPRLFYGANDLAERGPEMARSLVHTCAAITGVGAALTAASTVLWSSGLEPVEHLALLTGIGTTLPLVVMGTTMLILQVEQRPWAYLSVSLLGSVGAQVAGITALLLFQATATVYLLGYAAGVSVAASIGVMLSKTARYGLANRKTVRAALSTGMPTIPHSMAIFVLALGDRLIIQNIDGTAAVGRYQVAYALGALPIALISALQTAWIPITFASTANRRWVDLASSAAVITRLGALVVAGLVVISPIGLTVLAPASFDPEELQVVCALVALAALPWSIYLPMSQVLFWERQTKPLLWVTPTAAVANLVSAALLLPALGLEGAAAATLLALALQAVLVARATRRMASVPWRWRTMLGNTGLGALTVVGVLALPGGSTGWIVRVLLLIAIVVVSAKTVSAAIRVPEAPAATQ